jgi:hypothetical protein
MDGVVASRLCASFAVGITAFLLWRVVARLFADQDHRIGTATGLAYVVFMLATGGQNAQPSCP